jgi:hypothetical protein
MNWNHSGPKCIINCSLVDMFSTALEALDTLGICPETRPKRTGSV